MPNYQIRADIFPVNLTLVKDGEETQFEKARVVLTLDHVYVFQDATPKPTVVFEDRLTSYSPPVPVTRVRKTSQLYDRTARFSTEEGYDAAFIKTGGCGCGSRLKTASLDSIMPNDSIAQAASTQDAL